MKKVLVHNEKTNELIEIDEVIAPLISELNKIDFLETLFCCAGHKKEQFYIMFNFNQNTLYFLNKVFDHIVENYDGPIKFEITVWYRKEFEDKVISIRSCTPKFLYNNLSENEKAEFCNKMIKGFSYWLHILIHKPNLYFCK